MGRALRGEAVQIAADRLSCALARFCMGLEEPKPDGVAWALRAWGDADDEAIASAYLDKGWRLESASPFIIYFPYPCGDLEPDVLVKIGTRAAPASACWARSRRWGRPAANAPSTPS
ncbi:MAG: hypothetical protein AMK73_09115 [Planctomycetes bacterium SM23_32]|nr:MAG: hypothetical protein AMK73_09115 [Planctomycetes bacterium SM23_32]